MRLLIVVTVGALSISSGSAMSADALFGCDARTPSVCYFRIFYQPRGTRDVVLPAGMQVNIPGVQIGREQYCVGIGVRPRSSTCQRKTIGAKYNS